MPAHIRNIADVSGAGDTVISVAACCLALGVSPTLLSSLRISPVDWFANPWALFRSIRNNYSAKRSDSNSVPDGNDGQTV